MKFFHIFYTMHDSNSTYNGYGVYPVMAKVYPNLVEVHDAIAVKEQPYKISISNITEVTDEQYFENMEGDELDTARKKYTDALFGGIKVLDNDEMRDLGLDQDRLEEIQFAVNKSMEQAVDFDVLIMRFISSVIKQYAESSGCTSPTAEYYERFDVCDTCEVDKQTNDEMLMAYKMDLAKLADRFDTLIDILDDPNNDIQSELYTAFSKLSKMLPGLWN